MDTIHVTADADTLCRRATELVDAGRLEVARPLLAAAKALGQSSPELSLISARISLDRGAWDEALEELDSAVAAAPAHAGLRKFRADARKTMGDVEGAARDAAEAVIIEPGDPLAKAILGGALLDLGRTDEAVACLTEAVGEEPAEIDYRQALATALEKAGRRDAAFRVLADGIALCPANISLRNAAILLCLRIRDFNQAVRLAERARSQGAVDACTLGMEGHALSSLGRHDEAARAYQDALKLGPDDPYVRHLVVSSGAMPDSKRAPEDYIRTVFNGYADRFEGHLISLGYSIPGVIRSILQNHPKIIAGLSLGPVLDLGCGTGLVALATGDLALGPFTGVDLSPRMLSHARAKRLYTELCEADILTYLAGSQQRWPLILAADVLIYFGALEELLARVHDALEPGGWFVFSVEEVLADHDGVMPGNGSWALQRRGRYAHSPDYVYEAACAAGFRVVRMNRPVVRHEVGEAVPGLLLTLERIRRDD
jgi:predicted TPR repeat methyltransferase